MRLYCFDIRLQQILGSPNAWVSCWPQRWTRLNSGREGFSYFKLNSAVEVLIPRFRWCLEGNHVFWHDFLLRDNDIRIPILIMATSLIIYIVIILIIIIFIRDNDIRIPIFITATSLIIFIVMAVLGTASFSTSLYEDLFWVFRQTWKFGFLPKMSRKHF